MKHHVLLFAAIVSALPLPGQESYTIKMTVRIEGLPPEYAPYAEQDIVTQIKGAMSRTEVSSMMYTSLVYFRNDSLTTLNDVMGNRNGFVASKAELEGDKTTEKNNKPQIVYTGEKKTIAGYECTKAIVTQLKELKGNKKDTLRTTVWVTEKIRTDQTPRRAHQRRGNMDLGDLKGHPLQMEVSRRQDGNDIKVLMTTQSVDTAPLPDSLFIPDTKGYSLMGYSEWKEKNQIRPE